MAQLPADCLNEILEYLEDDIINLHSCLLVNHLWCNISVRIFWRNVWKYKTSNFRTLIACLPNESKEILYNNGIIISTPTSKPPMFNYATFCKFLSTRRIRSKLELLLLKNKKEQSITLLNDFSNCTFILTQEIIKLFFIQNDSLKKLQLYEYYGIEFYPGAEVCLKNLSELHCISSFSSEFFYQLSQICHNISTLNIITELFLSEGLIDLISAQRNLKSFGIVCRNRIIVLTPLIEKLPNTLIKLNYLNIYNLYNEFSLLFIARLVNLQEVNLYFYIEEDFIDFEKLQYAILPNLQILKIRRAYPRLELLIKFLENNGKNLKECYIGNEMDYSDDSLNLAIAKFCPNLRKLSIGFKNRESETMKMVLNSCQYLESINIWCGGEFLSKKEASEIIVKYSHKNFYEIIFSSRVQVKSFLEELESFFISWMCREPRKSLSLIIVNNYTNNLDVNDENMKIILNKYTELGVIKKFKVKDFDYDEEFNWYNRMY
ncbi:hypothetical protein C1645_833601 [Glomus cerebriforme]|uniref:F-box domain-containing protein n=1 Tax=Glomus cerebriforme TaxID=658196 RepID=A0A397SBA6_9GLOM|nr:hypothetical protein C1645_833601 [Glomus cerebriforme]